MAEAMKGLHRSYRCTEVCAEDIGKSVTVMGWVQKQRNKGGIIFVGPYGQPHLGYGRRALPY